MKPQRPPSALPQGLRLWLFRLAAAGILPLLLLLACEGLLRLAGMRTPTGFLVKHTSDGIPVFVDNPEFTRPEFGAALKRHSVSLHFTREKPADTIRILVLGESAALGDPQSEFGLPRMIEAQLGLRHPGVRFEVINAAITAINSHTIRRIARDCVQADADAWVVYMGNNEAVGPYGAGTVFGGQTPPLSLIRGNLALHGTAIGQLVQHAFSGMGRSNVPQEWGGMEMFLEQRLAVDDPRLETLRHHFLANLTDILRTAAKAEAGVVLSTVAVNLRDCAPFASSDADKSIFEKGKRLVQQGDHEGAIAAFSTAGEQSGNANLHYLWGKSLLATGDPDAAIARLNTARNLDELRFRCDEPLNTLIRQTAAEHDGVRLADPEAAFHALGGEGVSGREFFHEHVHLTFNGNYHLGRIIAAEIEQLPQVADLLPPEGTRPWPSLPACAGRLAWNPWMREGALSEMIKRVREPPFPHQVDHREHLDHLLREHRLTRRAMTPEALSTAIRDAKRAVNAFPDDGILRSLLTFLLQASEEDAAALIHARHAARLSPTDSSKWIQLGRIQRKLGDSDTAIVSFRRAVDVNPEGLAGRQELAGGLLRAGHVDAAEAEARALIGLRPAFGPGYLTLARAYDAQGESERADLELKKALAHQIRQKDFLEELATTLETRSWHAEAAGVWLNVVTLYPNDLNARLHAAQQLSRAGMDARAETAFQQTLRFAPQSAEARYLAGQHHALRDEHDAARRLFSEAVGLDPARWDIRLNLGMALLATGDKRGALAEFEGVLQQKPGQPTAREFAEALRQELTAPKNP